MSKVFKTIIVVAILVGLPHVGMSTVTTDNNMGSLEDIRTKTILTEAQITYFEAVQKLQEVKSGKASNPEFKSMITPSMNASPMGVPMGNREPPIALVGDNNEVLGVMGVGGKYKATIRKGEGVYKVSQGDKFSGGVITHISLDKVVLKQDGKSVQLPFVE